MFMSKKSTYTFGATEKGTRYCSCAFENNNIMNSADMVLCLSAVLLSLIALICGLDIAVSGLLVLCLVLRLCIIVLRKKVRQRD